MHSEAFIILTWSTPMGLTFEHTDGFLGRASEKMLVKVWAVKLNNIPIGYLIMANKGFDKTTGYYPNFNTILHPAFLQSKKNLSVRYDGIFERVNCNTRAKFYTQA